MRRKINPELKEYLQLFAKDYTVEEILPKVNKIFNENYTKIELQKYLVRNKIKYKYKNKKMIRKMGLDKPIGSEYTKPDGMVMIKIAKNKWEYKQRYIYEQYHGVKLPEDVYVIFLNHDRNDFRIENLKAVHRNICSYISNHKLYSTDEEITKLGITTAKLMYKTKKVQNKR